MSFVQRALPLFQASASGFPAFVPSHHSLKRQGHRSPGGAFSSMMRATVG